MLLDQHGQPFRFTPAMPVQSYVTWTVAAPTAPGAGFWRAATCDEVDCPAWAGGWVSKIDEATPLGHAQAAYLRSDRTRRSSEERGPDGLTWFTYAAGQTCFQAAEHRVRAGRPPCSSSVAGTGGPTSAAAGSTTETTSGSTISHHTNSGSSPPNNRE